MVFLKKIKYKKDVVPFTKGYTIEFNAPCTFLVGENGCGKSTILDTIREHFKIADQTYLKRHDLKDCAGITVEGKPKVCYYDAHADNLKYSSVFGDDIGMQMAQQRNSSGISSLLTLKKKLEDWKIKDSIILLDEPCRGLSIKNQYKLLRFLIHLTTNGNQLICSTHSEAFMELNLLEDVFKLYSVEHGRYRKYQELMDEWKDIESALK